MSDNSDDMRRVHYLSTRTGVLYGRRTAHRLEDDAVRISEVEQAGVTQILRRAMQHDILRDESRGSP